MRPVPVVFAGLLLACGITGCIGVATDASTTNNKVENNIRIDAVQVRQNGSQSGMVTAISPEEILAKVDSARRPFASGWSDSTGLWMLSRQKIQLTEKMSNQEAINIAEIRAKQKIAEFLGSNLSAKESSFLSIENVDGKEKYTESFSSEIHIDVNQFLRGVTLLKAEKKGEFICADFYVTGRMIDATHELERQLKEAPPGTVRSSGYGLIVDNRIPPAKQNALQLALRNAVEQVMGTTIVGQSELMNSARVKSKVISQSVGQIKEYRIVKEGIVGSNYQVITVATVDKDSLLDNYSALVRSMGNPVFFVNTEDPDLRTSLNDFMKELGFTVTTDHTAANFLVDARCTYLGIKDEHYGDGIQIDMHLELLNVKTGELYLTMQNTPRLTSTYSGSLHQIRQSAAKKAFKEIRKTFHAKLNKVIFDWVVNGHDISIVFKGISGDADYTQSLERALDNIPGIRVLNKELDGDTLVFKCTCIGATSDVDDFLHDAMTFEFGENAPLPQTTKIELDEIQLTCSK